MTETIRRQFPPPSAVMSVSADSCIRPEHRTTHTADVVVVQNGLPVSRIDTLAVEEPLEIRLVHGPRHDRQILPLSTTMRTPGHDLELAAGYVVAEGIVADRHDLEGVVSCGQGTGSERVENIVRVEIRPGVVIDEAQHRRFGLMTSSCGLCGKSTLSALESRVRLHPSSQFRITDRAIHELPGRLRQSQMLFDRTGGLHAAALVDHEGNVLLVREDVGRHNAVDKVIGHEYLADRLPREDCLLFVSSRASYELMQKALMAGISTLATVGAPSSLAVDLARTFGATLIGFVREQRFTIYAGAECVLVGPR